MGDPHGVHRFDVGLKYLARPDHLEFRLPETHCYLVTNEGTALTQRVIASLEKYGSKVVVLNLPGITTSTHKASISLEDHGDASVEKAIQEVHQQYGKIGAVIHLHPHFEFAKPNFTQHFSAEKNIVRTVFFLAKHVQQDLNDLGKSQRSVFMTVTRMDGALGQGRRGNTSVVGGGLPGLVKCLNLEWSPVFCRAVDIQPEWQDEKIAESIIEEVHDANVAIMEVGRSDAGRQTPAVIPTPVNKGKKIVSKVNQESVFLVSGGARGVTAQCVIEMANTFQCKFILLGRSDYSFELPSYAFNHDDEAGLKREIMNALAASGEKPSLPKVKATYKNIAAKKEIMTTIQAIESAGGKAEYVRGNVTDLSSFKKQVSEIESKWGKINGVIHGAGRLADKYIQDKSEADFENVLSVKLDGLLSLLGAIDIHKLDHLILFSSVAGFYGNLGQSDYAIANEILSKAARLFKTNHPNTHVSAINWGAWDSGMVSGELKAQFEAAGITLVNSDGGATMLVNELNEEYSSTPQMIIGGTLPEGVSHLGELRTHIVKRKLDLKDNEFLNHHVIQGNAVLPVVNAVGWMAQSCERLYPDYVVFEIQDTRLFKGIVFDGSEKDEYILELKEVEKNESQITFDVAVMSEGGKLPTYHYKTRVILQNKTSLPEQPIFNWKKSASSVEDGKKLYSDGSLFHDKYFQGIEEIEKISSEEMVISCLAPEVPLEDQGQFPVKSVNTFFADIQYQGMVVWVQRYAEGAKSLPLQTDKATLYRPIPFGKKLWVHIKIDEFTDVKMSATCTVFDEEGKVYSVTSGAAVTISKQLVW